jgi:hypothetical protein
MSEIPKNIHLTWKHKNLLDSKAPMIVNGIARLATVNPDWNMTIYVDDEIEAYLKKVMYPSDYSLIEDAHIVAKSDIWRLYKLYNEGGLYMDIDRLCNAKLSDLLTENTKWVLPIYQDYDFSHDFMMTCPQNPAFAAAIDLYLTRRREGITNIYFLGPQTYMHAVTKTLCGQMINTNPGEQVFAKIREIIGQAQFITTYRENPPFDTIIYRSDEDQSNYDFEMVKRSFYAEESVMHWTGEW